MPIVTISEAARLVGRGRKTIQRYVADGRISVAHDDAGHRGIDISELIRVFGEIKKSDACFEGVSEAQRDTLVDAGNDADDVSALKAEIIGLKALLNEKDCRIDDLKATMRLLEVKVDQGALCRPWWKFW